MKIVVSRVLRAEVKVRGQVVSSINQGVLLLVGVEKDDTDQIVLELVNKVANLRIFEDDRRKLFYSIKDTRYEVLCISNFTLCADTKKGRRPSFDNAMIPDKAERWYNNFVRALQAHNIPVKTGIFGEYMEIGLVMDGPLNIILER